jgi:hypothetical protein
MRRMARHRLSMGSGGNRSPDCRSAAMPCRDLAVPNKPPPGAIRSIPMMDVLMLAIAAGLFAVGIGYAYVCERL